MRTAAPDSDQQLDLDYRLVLGQLFTLVVYAQLVLEQASLTGLHRDVLDTILEVFLRGFSAIAVELHGKASSTDDQQHWALASVHKPSSTPAGFQRVWQGPAPAAPAVGFSITWGIKVSDVVTVGPAVPFVYKLADLAWPGVGIVDCRGMIGMPGSTHAQRDLPLGRMNGTNPRGQEYVDER